MESTILLDKMKKNDFLIIGLLTFIVILYFVLNVVGLIQVPLYLNIILGIAILVIYILEFSLMKKRNNLKIAFENIYTMILDDDYSSIKDLIEYNSENEVYILTNYLVDEIKRKSKDIDIILKLAKSIERDELKHFKKTSSSKEVNNAIRVITNTYKENIDNIKVTSEFFKSIKAGKFNKINVYKDNIIEQQLNVVLDSMNTLFINLKKVQDALFQGDYNFEYIEESSDIFNISDKVNTLLKATNKANHNLYKAIINIDKNGLKQFTNSSYKGNQVKCFMAVEKAYEDINISIDNIVFALENNHKIKKDEVTEIFFNLIEMININLNTVESNSSSIDYGLQTDELQKDISNNVNYDVNNNVTKNIENNLEMLKNTIDSKKLVGIDLSNSEYCEEKVELAENMLESNIAFDMEESEENIYDKKNKESQKEEQQEENHKEKDYKEKEYYKENKENKENKKADLENFKNVAIAENDLQDVEIEPKDNEPKDVGELFEECEVVDMLTNGKEKERKNTIKDKENEKGKPLTYQRAVKNGDIDNHKDRTVRVASKRETASKRVVKEPMTYQKFLENANNQNTNSNKDKVVKTSKKNALSNKDNKYVSSRNSSLQTEKNINTKKEANRSNNNSKREKYVSKTRNTLKNDKYSGTSIGKEKSKAKFTKSVGSVKRQSEIEEKLGRDLTQVERNELNLYGEILTKEARADMDKILSSDLGGF